MESYSLVAGGRGRLIEKGKAPFSALLEWRAAVLLLEGGGGC
jgi:hypothetical protein